jgi:hypothetical protein
MTEAVIDYAVRSTDARRNNGHKVPQAIVRVTMVNKPQSIRQALLERLKAAGVL